MVVKAAASQFASGPVKFHRVPFLISAKQVEEALIEAADAGGIVVYTLVRPDLKVFLEQKAKQLQLVAVDVMGPIIDALKQVTELQPKNEPGVIRKIDEAYFSKVEAIEFAVKYDDGKEPRGLLKADIVIIGISRASKTPLCMYLAHKGIKAANLPLVPEVPPPAELYQVPPQRVVGLTIKPALLFEIRKERLKSMGLSPAADYASFERILQELEYADSIMRKVGCPVLDVTNKATEETAAKVLEFYYKGVGK
ncbi:putative pyruvate, phosphate dikinase regulatory protein [Sporomusaceae bacterium FL31]|nr:putative pyruvate, phosphate dikinase regulatory protein [Sporomusaceae bacterium FL31]GCE34323.1 putative pyruvate, phosphate dikinase regulatory protein [Sporomusaceae bacterium]